MAAYDVYENPRSGFYEAVKSGFSWPAFFFTVFWMGLKRVPRLGFADYVPAIWFLFGLAFAIWLLQPDESAWTLVLWLAAAIAFGIFVGQRGN